MKRCTKCKVLKEHLCFNKKSSASDGLNEQCRDCANARNRAYHRENREAVLVRMSSYHRENRGARLVAMSEYGSTRRAELGDAERERVNAALRANPDARRNRESKRRARLLESYVEDVVPLVILELDDGICQICFEDVDPLDFHVDHIIPIALGGEHSYLNCQLAHPSCNLSKGMKI